jgi:hypothetical protein
MVIVPLTVVDGGEELLWFDRKGGAIFVLL